MCCLLRACFASWFVAGVFVVGCCWRVVSVCVCVGCLTCGLLFDIVCNCLTLFVARCLLVVGWCSLCVVRCSLLVVCRRVGLMSVVN